MLVVLELLSTIVCAIPLMNLFMKTEQKYSTVYCMTSWKTSLKLCNICKWGISKGRNLACTICCFRTSMECNGDYNNEEDNWCMYLSRFNLRYHNVAPCSLFIRSITLLTCCLVYITTFSCYHCIFFFNFVFWYRGYDVKR